MSGTLIHSVAGRSIWDSRGRPTVEVEVTLNGGSRGRGIAPAGASRGRSEAVDLRDGGDAFGGMGVSRAVENIDGTIAEALRGVDATDQSAVDRILIERDGTADKSNLGGNSLTATSMAVAHAAAAASGMPLWKYLATDALPHNLPLPQIQVFGGGAHAAGRIDVQDFMVIAVGASDFAEALNWTAEVYRAAGQLLEERGLLRGTADEGGFWPEFSSNEQALEMLLLAIEKSGRIPSDEISIALDVAASELRAGNSYRLLRDDRELGSSAMRKLLGDWIRRYPIVSVEDPLAEDDIDGFAVFTRAFGHRAQVIGDDLLVTDATRIQEAAKRKLCSGVLLKPNQAGTLSECRAAYDAASCAGLHTVISARSGETEDVTIVHLAVGWGVPQIKVGSIAHGERTAKWNECLRIADALPAGGGLPPRHIFPWGKRFT